MKIPKYSMALAGPLTLGLSSGVATGRPELAFVLPLVLVGATISMVPALYIATAMQGAAPSLRALTLASFGGLEAAGTVLLGMSAPFVVIMSTTTDLAAVSLACRTIVIVAVYIGIRRFFQDTPWPPERRAEAGLVFVVWSLIAVGIGGLLLDSHLSV